MGEIIMKKLLSILLALSLLIAMPAALAEGGVTKILVGQDPSPAPIGWINEDGTVDGYDRAVINAVDELLEAYEFEVEVTDFQGLFAGVDSGRYQIIVDDLTWKPERAERYLFSNNYYVWNTTVVAVRKGDDSIKTLDDLAGKRTVLHANGAFDQLFVENYNEQHTENPVAITYSDQDRLVSYQQLADGHIDFLVQELASLLTYQVEFGIELDYLLPTMEEQMQMQDPAGYFVFPMTDEGEALRDAVDEAIKTLREDGTLSELAVEYFGFDIFEGID